jgi:hypothetical protein
MLGDILVERLYFMFYTNIRGLSIISETGAVICIEVAMVSGSTSMSW